MGEQPAPGILILGVPRSGTTLLRRLLDAHPNISCPGETNLLGAAARFLQSDTLAEGLDFGVLSGLGFAGFAEDEVLERLREFTFGFLRDHAAREGKARWADKSAMDAFYLPAIERLAAGHVRFVCVTRHALDVVVSLGDLCDRNGGYLSELHPYVTRHPQRDVAFAHAWVDLSQQLSDLVTRRPDDCLQVRYEDLVTDPDTTLASILAFVGEEPEEGLVEAALGGGKSVGLGDWKTYAKSGIDQSSVGRWKSLSPHAQGTLGKLVNPTLVDLGYESVATGDDRDAEEARRRYEIGLMLRGMKQDADASDADGATD